MIINAFGLHQAKDHARLNVGFWGAGRYRCSGGDGSTILSMLVAYDLIRDAQYPDGRPVLTPEMDRRIQNDLLLAGCEDSENWKAINNKCGPGRALSAAAGILFERPQSTRHALNGFQGETGVMPPKGGFMNLSDDDVKAAVDYMVESNM